MKKYALNRIKMRYSYTYSEIETLFGVSGDTVKFWVRSGLERLDTQSLPRLVLGKNLKTFLQKQQQKYKLKLEPNHFYCVRCRAGVLPVSGTVQESIRNKLGKNKRLVMYQGTCPRCQKTICRYGSRLEWQCQKLSPMFLPKQKGLNELPLFRVS